MNVKSFWCLGSCLLIMLINLPFYVDCKTWTKSAVESPLTIGAFNIQNLGNSKMANKTVMNIVKRILLRYDLVLIQEIVSTNEDMMDGLVKDLNRIAPRGVKYMMAISERLGRGNAKEQYAYLYRNDKVKFLKGHTYPDEKDDFMRPPFIAHFATPTLRDMESMLAIGIHTQPKFAANETSALAKVYDYAAKTFKVKDAIIMGDMNAGCANVRISDWDTIELWKRKEFTWLITHDYDTTLSTNCCPYDRFVIAGSNMEDAIIWESISAYKYRDEYGISTEMALAVSDHWPIEVKLRGGTSKETEANLTPSLCLQMHDSRERSIPEALTKQKKSYGFSIDSTETLTTLHQESFNATLLIQNLEKLGAKFPEFVASEVVEAVAYKMRHGVLLDRTSHNNLEAETHAINIYFEDGQVTIWFCSVTTVN